jgi:hypothetical protein
MLHDINTGSIMKCPPARNKVTYCYRKIKVLMLLTTEIAVFWNMMMCRWFRTGPNEKPVLAKMTYPVT